MNTLTRTLVASAAALAIGASAFAISASTRPDVVATVDAPLAVPASTVESVPVLAPVAEGDLASSVEPGALTSATLGLSEPIGSATVVVPDAAPDGSETIDPGTEGVAPGTEGLGPVPPELIATALALDSSAGDAADAVSLTGGAGLDGGPPASGLPASGLPASDPCAVTEGAVADGSLAEGCPEGARATLLSLPGSGDLQVWAMADPVTGPTMGSSIYCTAADTAGSTLPAGALRLGALTTSEATVSITYWPDSDPSATASAELNQVAVNVGGSARHCGQTAPLSEGRYSGLAFAIGSTGAVAEVWSLSFDSGGRETVPQMSVVPVGTNWVWVGVHHAVTETASIKGFALADGGVATCADAASDGVAGLRKDIDDHTSAVTAAWLSARNFNGAYTRVTSALLYVPEGTSVGLCGYTFSSGEPSWDIAVPDRIEMATASAPDTWQAVVSIDSVTTSRPGNVYMAALTQMGGWCGTGTAITVVAGAAGGPMTTPVDHEVCRLSGQNVQLRLETFATDGSQDPAADPIARFLIPTRSCTGACAEPPPRAYTVYLPGLGRDACIPAEGDDCSLDRRTSGAFATITVTWDAGGEGARETWAVGGTSDQAVEDTGTAGVQFDTAAAIMGTLSTNGLSASLSTTLRWDRAVNYSVNIVGACFGTDGSGAVPAAVTGRSAPRSAGVFSADVSFGGLCPGASYQLVVTTTDEAGNRTVAAPPGAPGVSPDVLWYSGGRTMPQKHIEITASIEIIKNDRVNNAWLVRNTKLNILEASAYPSFGATLTDRCFPPSDASHIAEPASVTVPLASSYDIQPDINVVTDWYYYPTSPRCAWRSYDRWVSPTGVRVSLESLLAGSRFTGTLVPRSFPTEVENPIPFTYTVILRAEYVDE